MINLETAMQHVDESLHCVVDKGNHIVITYHHMQPETFRGADGNICPIRTQFRGICFDKKTGECVRLPFHKFFNYGEIPDQEFDFNAPFYAMTKLDGSLVAPYLVGERLIWGTKSGETEMSNEIVDVLSELPYWDRLFDFVLYSYSEGFTPLFEYVSPSNRIVLKYDKPDIVLIGWRRIEDGKYATPGVLQYLAEHYGIPVVSYQKFDNDSILTDVKDWEESEGVVLFQNQNFMKVKSLWYVQLHKNKELIEQEKNVVELIVDDNIDDVLPLLQEDQKADLLSFVDDFWDAINKTAQNFTTFVSLNHFNYETRKEYALSGSSDSDYPLVKHMTFRYFDSDEKINDNVTREELLNALKNSLTSNTKYEAFKAQNGLSYRSWQM